MTASSPRGEHRLHEEPLHGQLDGHRIMASLSAHQVPGCEFIDTAGGRHARLVNLAGETRALRLRFTRKAVDGAINCPAEELPAARQLVRHWFGLDLDLALLTRKFDGDSILAPLIEQRPHLRPLGHPDGFEAAITTILGQQVSLAAMRLFSERLVSAHGGHPVGIPGRELVTFPTPEAIAVIPVPELRATLGLTSARARTVSATATLFADGFRLFPGCDPDQTREQLSATFGIGPWTVEYLALRVLGDLDAFPASDAVLRRALGGITAVDAAAMAERWRPYRGFATTHLWAADQDQRSSTEPKSRWPQ